MDGTCLGCVDGYTGSTCKEGNIIRFKIIHLQNKAKPETCITDCSSPYYQNRPGYCCNSVHETCLVCVEGYHFPSYDFEI